MNRQMIYPILAFLIGIILIQCTSQSEDVIVTVGELSITDDQAYKTLKSSFPKNENYRDIELSKKMELLDPLIVKKLRVNAAYDLGLDKNPKFQRQLEDFKMKTLGNKYYEVMIIDKLITQEDIELELSRQGVELKASHILIGYEGARRPNKRTRTEADELVAEILKELKEGADFGTTAIKYSDDPSAKQNKGDLGYFTWGRMVGPFQEAAWNLKVGEISDAVETQFGIHIIKLEDRRNIQNYKPDRSSRNISRMKQNLLRTQADSARALWEKHFASLKEKYNYTLYPDSINTVSTMLTEKIKKEKIVPGTFTSKQKEITFAEFNSEKITLGTLIDQYADQLAESLKRFSNQRVLKSEIDRLSLNKIVMADIHANNFHEIPELKKEIERFTEDQLSRLAEEKTVKDKPKPSDEEIRAYFENNREKFVKGAEIEIWEIYVKDEKLAEEVASQARKGANFEKLARKYSENKTSKKKGGYIGYRTMQGRGQLSKEAHNLGPGGKIGGPIKYQSGWSVFKTGKKKDEVVPEFSKSKVRATNMLIREQSHQAKTDWENSLRDKYVVTIDEDKLKEM